jgi:hypothetical protein
MKKEGKIRKFNIKKRTVVNILGRGALSTNGKLNPLNETTVPPTYTGII